MKVWTMRYTPFVMGGSVWQPVACEIKEAQGPYDLGRGYQGYLVVAPNGTTFVAEAKTGAFVGPSIQDVKEDIETGDPKLMEEQVIKAALDYKRAEVIPEEEFWRLLKVSE